jgi:phosphohistidine swiveling domain-containing protein
VPATNTGFETEETAMTKAAMAAMRIEENANEAAAPATGSAAWTAPGPGSWQQDPSHWPRPVTPWTAAAFPSGFRRGFAESTRRYGVMLSHFEATVVNGRLYQKPVPATEAGEPGGPEAAVGRRIEAAREAFESRLWLRDLELWDSEFKPDSIRRNRGLQSVDPGSLTDAALADHLAAAHANQEEMHYRHHKFNMAAMLPVGRFAAQAAAWTGASRAEVLGLLQGASPISRGTAEAELNEVGRALVAAGIGPERFAAQPPAAILERLRTMEEGGVGAAVRGYLDASGSHAAGGYDVTERTVGELPDMILQAFWGARTTQSSDDAAVAAREAALRARVPEEHIAEFDRLLAEARLVHRLRDERGIFNDIWAAGISRRAILEVGRRLAIRGRIDCETLIFQASLEEMQALLRGEPGPSGRELQARAEAVGSIANESVPASLGDEPAPPPPADGLPEHARLAAQSIGFVVDEIFGITSTTSETLAVTGRAVCPGVYEGTARVIGGPEDFNRVREGDVLVTTSTSASINVVLPLLGAIVTDRGGLLSHAAIVAREYGIPGVVGTRDATRVIPDGAWVRVDGSTGRVEVLR